MSPLAAFSSFAKVADKLFAEDDTDDNKDRSDDDQDNDEWDIGSAHCVKRTIILYFCKKKKKNHNLLGLKKYFTAKFTKKISPYKLNLKTSGM
jgi:hypothetical protein